MAGQHHQFNGHELGQTLGDSEGQGGLVCCSPWGGKESDMTWQLNNNVSLKENSRIFISAGRENAPSRSQCRWSRTDTQKALFVRITTVT